jgi:predicted RNase H-like nuclease (RuvC/YqgF family)
LRKTVLILEKSVLQLQMENSNLRKQVSDLEIEMYGYKEKRDLLDRKLHAAME